MAGNIKGITIEFRGDTTQLGKALSDVNKEIKTTDSALREVDKALKLDPTNVELLAQKEELLSKQIEQTAEKLDLQKKAAAEAGKALQEGTISQEEYAKLTAQVATTSSKLEGLKTAAEQTSAGLNQTADGAREAGDAVGDAGDEAEASKAKWIDWSEVIKVAAAAAAAALAAVGAAAVAGTKALVDSTLEAASYADEMATMSSVTGLSAQKLQELEYSAELVDVSLDTMTSSMTKNINMMDAARDGSSAAAEAYAALGITVTNSDGTLRDSEEVYWEVIDALGNVTNETERNALAMDLLGKSAMDLNPLIETGSEGMAAYAQQAHEAGYVMDDELIDSFGELDNNMQRLNNGASAAKRALGTVLLPSLTTLSGTGVDLLGQFTQALLDTDGDITQLAGVVETVFPQVVQAIIDNLPQLIETAVQIIEALVTGLTEPDTLEALMTAIESIMDTLVDGITTLLPILIPAVFEIIMTIVNALIKPENLTKIIECAIEIVTSLATGISEHLDELIPAVLDCILTIVDELLKPENLLKLIMAGVDIIKAVAGGLVQALGFDKWLDALADIWKAVSDFFSGLIEKAKEWGHDMIQNFADGIIGAADLCTDGIDEIASGIKNLLGHSTPKEGPLKNDDEWGSDFMQNFIDGMESKEAELQATVNQTASIIADGSTVDYTSQLGGISAQLAMLAGGRGNYVINVQLGDQSLGSAVISAQQMENFRTGGN